MARGPVVLLCVCVQTPFAEGQAQARRPFWLRTAPPLQSRLCWQGRLRATARAPARGPRGHASTVGSTSPPSARRGERAPCLSAAHAGRRPSLSTRPAVCGRREDSGKDPGEDGGEDAGSGGSGRADCAWQGPGSSPPTDGPGATGPRGDKDRMRVPLFPLGFSGSRGPCHLGGRMETCSPSSEAFRGSAGCVAGSPWGAWARRHMLPGPGSACGARGHLPPRACWLPAPGAVRGRAASARKARPSPLAARCVSELNHAEHSGTCNSITGHNLYSNVSSLS